MEPTIAQKIADPKFPYHTPGVTTENEHHTLARYPGKVITLSAPDPIVGGKCWAFAAEGPGTYLLEAGPGILRAIACTHTGSSYFSLFDGPGGRLLFPNHPGVMGHWMLDAGFNIGLAVEIGGKIGVSPHFVVVWMKYNPKNGNGKR